MRVAIAGAGGLARYLCEELPADGTEVIVLTRSVKPELEKYPGVKQFVTDYSVQSVVEAIGGCSTLVSTILDYTTNHVDVHLQLIEACKQSKTCKRFIPSEYGGNLEDFPDQPGVDYRTHEPVRKALREQRELEWTLISVGWFIDFIVPSQNRYLKDAGEAFPVDLKTKSILIPGTGKEPVDVTSARDTAKAIARLLKAPNWEPYTYLSGEKTCWNDVAALMIKQHPEMTVERRSLYQLIESIRTSTDEFSRAIAEYQIVVPSHAASLDPAKVADHKAKFFDGIKFRVGEDLLREVARQPDIIV